MQEYYVPAEPGTVHLTYVGTEEFPFVYEQPVIAWKLGSKFAKPVVSGEFAQGLKANYAVEFNGNMLVDLQDNSVFKDFDSEGHDVRQMWADACDETPIAHDTAPVLTKAAKGEYDLQFGTKKPYKTKSFWCFEDATRKFVFEIEGGEQLPDDPRVEKVNRATFLAVKKEHGIVPLTRLIATAAGESPASSEDEEFDDGGLL